MKHQGSYSVFVNETKVLGPTTFAHGFIYAEETFTTCSCVCSLQCQDFHRSCCVSETRCGQCLAGFSTNGEGSCEKLGKSLNLFFCFSLK